jgi:hypothetical protein
MAFQVKQEKEQRNAHLINVAAPVAFSLLGSQYILYRGEDNP